MHTLLLRLMGPMQSWGVQSRFTVRDTGREPSKSAVIGLLCAALGRPRAEPVDDLASLRMGVRVDREGSLEMDYHTAMNVYKASGGKPKDTEVSRRYYLADALFLVGLETEDRALLERLYGALRAPVWPLYLGRKAFVPSPPICLPDGMRVGETLEEALKRYPFLGRGDPPERLRLVIDDPQGEIVRPDLPLSFAARRFAPRRARTLWITLDERPAAA
ncbi:MAG: type I-E CRISPR-associated protein Cas5/CasD [Chloroflexota bacterium]